MTSDASCLSGSVSSTPSPLPPIIVLSGSDRRPGRMPEGEQAFHPLSGYKGVDLRIDGRALVIHVIERLQASECFAAVYVAGPADAHREVIAGAGITEECLIDVDGRIGENVRAALEAVRRDFPGQPIAFTTCDVLPDAELLRRVMRRYGECVPCDVFFPLIAAPANEADMGASTWKPTYSLVDAPGEAPRKVLPLSLIHI